MMGGVWFFGCGEEGPIDERHYNDKFVREHTFLPSTSF
jgi:hypothetical protein